jgi:hypothetical protein
MESETYLFLSLIIIVMIGINTFLVYESKKKFICPNCNCPECPSPVICDIPSNQSFVNYLQSNLIKPFLNTTNTKDFLNKNVIFSDKNTMLFAMNYDKINATLRGSIDNNKYKINESNLRYMYPSKGKMDTFLSTYRLSEFPMPLLTFADTGLYFGYVTATQSWKIFIDNKILLADTLPKK